MEINISDIPDFLKDSEFYRNLDLNFDEPITIQKLKINDEVNNIKDFKKLFKTLNFFDVDKFPKSFIKYYQNNSKEVFDSLDHYSDVYQELLIDLCNLKIKNYKQFFVTHKIITLYKLNPEEYDNYISYFLNNAHEVLRDDDENYLMDDISLVDKVYSTEILELEPYIFNRSSNSIHLRVKKKHLYGRWEISNTVSTIKSIQKLIDKIKNNNEYDNFFYMNKELYMNNEYKIKINEFNIKKILEEFQKVIKWINSHKIS
uniref:Uncharacterized protein n=1 Tax=viral metagenome TaxID=1070528 RepID=A0A6C0AE38_9ZZZZ